MKAVAQRVTNASVAVDGEVIAAIGPGLLVLLGVTAGDADENARWLAEKLTAMRIFANENGHFDRSLLDGAGAMLVVSQFTLYADIRKGRRPSFSAALAGDAAKGLYDSFLAHVRRLGIAVSAGRFGADMQVASVNDGPVTIIVEHP